VIIKLAVGDAREVYPILYGVAVLFVLYFLRGPLLVTAVIRGFNVVSQAH